ncbi:MAG TPA: VOC family protein [Caulobacteraceae bacterium]|nr:VOC family protein [Caulobacteraceae bacterium]
MSIGSLGYLGFQVKDADAWETFATGVLGLMPGEAAGAARRYRLDDLAWRIAVEPGEADDLAYVGFEVAGPAELEAVRARLSDGGIAVGNGDPELLTERGVLGLISCQDPDGLPVEVFYGPTLRTETPFASPAGVAAFVTGDQGLGHIVLATRDMAAARRFYQDILGFRLSDVIRMRVGPQFSFDMEFFHCNPRHHTLALMPIPMPKRLHHFMIQVPTLDAVGFALERATAAAAPITASLGRHTNDQMVSFYSRTPAGFEVEFGQGAIEVDDATWRVGRHDKPSSWGHKRPAH